MLCLFQSVHPYGRSHGKCKEREEIIVPAL